MEADCSGLKDKWEVGKLGQLSVGDSFEKFIEKTRVGEGDIFGNC